MVLEGQVKVNFMNFNFDAQFDSLVIGVDEVGKAIQTGRPFTMAFVDIRMPYGIDGLETARQILSIDPDMEIIILTGYSDTPRQSMARQLGVSNFQLLKKPFDPDELMQMAQFLAHRHNMHQRRGEQRK